MGLDGSGYSMRLVWSAEENPRELGELLWLVWDYYRFEDYQDLDGENTNLLGE